jgi:hypothetical protein
VPNVRQEMNAYISQCVVFLAGGIVGGAGGDGLIWCGVVARVANEHTRCTKFQES